MPRMIELIRSSAVPANLMQAAAKGALSVPAAEMIEILVHLANHNKIFGQQARFTLAGWDEASSLAAASDPNTLKEVLHYMIARENLRPRLLPALLENPSVSEELLMELAATGSREVAEAMLKSERVNRSREILNVLRSNPNLTGGESENVSQNLPPEEPESPDPEVSDSPPADEILADQAPEPSSGPEDVLDEALMTYLSEHAAEIAAEGDKPFQAIGGVFDELEVSPENPPSAAAASAAGTVTAAAKPVPPAGHKASVQKKTFLSHDEERGSALQKISKLDIKGRIQLAMKGTKEERSILVRDGTKLVALAVLDSPKISDGEVERFAAQKNVLEAVLRGIPMKRRFAKHYPVIRNLVFNPRTPLDVSLGLMKNILVNDLRHLSANKEVSDTVRKLALKMFKSKTDTTKKGH
jgi:hypothetical protein